MNSKQNRFERRKQETHQKLIQAAVDLILEKGYAEVSIQDITDRADYARSTFYLHFDSIDDLIWEYFNTGWQEHTDRARELHQSADGDKPLLYYEILVDFLLIEGNLEFYRMVFSTAAPNFVREMAKQYLVQEIQSRLENFPELSAPSIPVNLQAHWIYGSMLQAIVWWLNNPEKYSPRQMADMIYSLLVSTD